VRGWVRLGTAASTGAAVLVVELMAVRLLAPWFGSSQLVWTHVIGVVLASLAVGQWLGGMWAEGGGRIRPGPVILLVVAGAFSVALPSLIAIVAPLTRPSDLRLEEALPFVNAGSLLVSILGLGIPMAALGAVTPWLVRLARTASSEPGRVAGGILAAGTLGSLLGAFGSTHFLLPWIGSAMSIRLAGCVLLLLALVLALSGSARRQRTSGRLVLFWLAGPIALIAVGSQVGPHGPEVLAAVETPYQSARIEIDSDGARVLRLNEGLDSFHSAYRPGSLWTGRYFDAFVLPVLAAPAGEDGLRRVLVLGLGGGTMARQLLAVVPQVEVTGVELDPQLVELGREWLGLPQETRVIAGVDGRVALQLSPSHWSAIVVDAYAQQIYVPAHMATREFFLLARERLVPGGLVALNLGGRTREDPVVRAVAAVFGEAFPGAVMGRVPGTRNWIVLGWRGERPAREAFTALLPWLSEFPESPDHAWVMGDGFAPVPSPQPRPLVDGDAPVEALAHQAWRSGA